MEALRLTACKNGSIMLNCMACFTRTFLRDLRLVACYSKLDAEFRSKGLAGRVGYTDIVFDEWRKQNAAEFETLQAEQVERAQRTTAKKEVGT
jgi:hypothetical protein